ncbi:MAG: discoidin domain-containing protein, partial [Bacteroidaceae bacterium]|nr:discoidin domain-containing protein [Bacteroidaceae bacterium]
PDVPATFHAIRQAKYDYDNATATADYIAAYNALKVYYDKLVAAYNTCNQTELDSKKTELQALIDKTNTLIASCGEVTYHSAGFDGVAPMQVDDANAKFYLSTNAQSTQEGPISGLIDGVVGDPASATYFHTDYSGSNSSDGLDHYIQVNLGESVKAFSFTYTNRHNTDANYAKTMTILGSTDGNSF